MCLFYIFYKGAKIHIFVTLGIKNGVSLEKTSTPQAFLTHPAPSMTAPCQGGMKQ